MHGRYILDAKGRPVPCEDLLTWGRWFETSNHLRILRRTYFPKWLGGHDGAERIFVSTVFLGLNHGFASDGPPVLWETMAFGTHSEYEPMDRYTSRWEAILGHYRMCLRVLGAHLLHQAHQFVKGIKW
jgi:hypothetical protein